MVRAKGLRRGSGAGRDGGRRGPVVDAGDGPSSLPEESVVGVGGVAEPTFDIAPANGLNFDFFFAVARPLTSAVLLKELPIFRPSGDLSSV